MMRNRVGTLVVIALLLGVASVWAHEGHDHSKDAQPVHAQVKADAKPVYACPMHPEVSQDKPGHCPKCGMKLKRGHHHHHDHHEN